VCICRVVLWDKCDTKAGNKFFNFSSYNLISSRNRGSILPGTMLNKERKTKTLLILAVFRDMPFEVNFFAERSRSSTRNCGLLMSTQVKIIKYSNFSIWKIVELSSTRIGDGVVYEHVPNYRIYSNIRTLTPSLAFRMQIRG
jgi:hypothetical protein